jgi:signal transduction histidine kinase
MDEGKVHQALLNILLNALQSSSSGDKVEIKGKFVRSPEKLFRIIVTDQGAGVTPEEFKHIFDPFFTTKQMGTGLGLPIVRNIMRNHGGDVYLESTPGAGTTACLEFSAS